MTTRTTPTTWRSRLWRQRRDLAALVVLQVASVGAGLALPTLNAHLIDEGVARGDQATIWKFGGWMLLLCLGQLAAAVGAIFVGARLCVEFGRRLREDVFVSAMRLSPGQVRRMGPASLLTRTTNDVMQVQMLVLLIGTVLAAAPLTMIGAIVLGIRQDAALAWLMALAVPVMLLVIGLFTWLALPGYRRLQPQIDRVNTVLREQLAGLRVTRVFTRERYEQERFGTANDALIATSMKVGRLYLSLGPVVSLVMSLAGVGVVWLGAHRVDEGQAGIGSVIAFISYLVQLMSATLMSTAIVMQLPRAKVSARRLREVMETAPEIDDDTRHDDSVDDRGRNGATSGLRLEGVTVRLPGADAAVLQDVSLRVRPGHTTALVGSTGSGKTTLIEVMHRAVEADAGSVRLDGVDLREMSAARRQSRIHVVPQRAQLFAGTIRSNLQFGADVGDAELAEALRVAEVDFLEAGLDSPVAPAGGNFSGGQRQRLCIARALVGDPDVLLLDDSLSALDGRSAEQVLNNLAADRPDACVVIATSRLSVAVRADDVAVLERGRLLERGSHTELVHLSPTYREFVDSQSMTEEIA